ncbi:MAG: hypothetical protein EXS36_04340 [Pedosphaera sp.]|nr:hypothetical protein [Pedosphaera sp.]
MIGLKILVPRLRYRRYAAGMKVTFPFWVLVYVAILTLLSGEWGQTQPAPAAAAPDPSEVLARGRGFEISRGEIEDHYNRAETEQINEGRPISSDEKEFRHALLLERIIFQKSVLSRGTDEDRRKADQAFDKFIEEMRTKMGTEAAFKREIARQGISEAYFQKMKRQEAVIVEVINREIRSKVKVSDAVIRKYYHDHAVSYQRPDSYRVAHLLISSRDLVTGHDLTEAQQQERRRHAASLLERARNGENFTTVVKQYSEDPVTRARGGELSLSRGQAVVEFEAASLALKPGQISDLVTTQFGYHIIKSIELKPAGPIPLAEVSKDIQEILVEQELDRRLPEWTLKVRKELGVEFTPAAPKRAWVLEAPAKELK